MYYVPTTLSTGCICHYETIFDELINRIKQEHIKSKISSCIVGLAISKTKDVWIQWMGLSSVLNYIYVDVYSSVLS